MAGRGSLCLRYLPTGSGVSVSYLHTLVLIALLALASVATAPLTYGLLYVYVKVGSLKSRLFRGASF